MCVEFKQVITGINLRPKMGAFGYSSVTLLTDGKENILFDTGAYGVRSIISRIISEYEVNTVFISHCHFDHCSNLDLFKGRNIYINRIEYENLCTNNSDHDLYKPLLLQFRESELTLFDSNQELSDHIQIKLTYGHTIGHSSLEFYSQDLRVLVAGDAIKSVKDYLDVDGFGNAQNRLMHLQTKQKIRNEYDIIIPGHSTMFRRDCLCESVSILDRF